MAAFREGGAMTPERLVEIEAIANRHALKKTATKTYALRDLLAAYRALQADLHTVEAISLGRRTVLIEQAHDLANQWKRAECAEAEATRYFDPSPAFACTSTGASRRGTATMSDVSAL